MGGGGGGGESKKKSQENTIAHIGDCTKMILETETQKERLGMKEKTCFFIPGTIRREPL